MGLQDSSGIGNNVIGRGRGPAGPGMRAELGSGGRGYDAGAKFGQPPPGYVAGRGRGLGDTRREALEAQASAARAAHRQQEQEEEGGGDHRPLDEEEGGLFADAVYEEDDVEADQIYAAVDDRMDSRRAKQRTERLESELKKYRAQNPTITQQFSDLKRELSSVSASEWDSIPDVGDYSVKKQKLEKYTPAPDSLLEMARKESAMTNTDATFPGATTDLASIGEGRGAVLGQKLDRVSDSVSGQTVVDPKGYLTQMDGLRINSETDVGDIKKLRHLLKSVTSTNPKHGPGWIAAARLEEFAGRMQAARKEIAQGCKMCPTSEEVWLEAVRLHPPEQAKTVLASAVKHIPNSVRIWLQASALEDATEAKRLVLRKALEIIPNSAKLWKAAVELESPQEAKILLTRAVECVPESVDLWLALARLESYENAREVLKRALNALPMEPTVWLTGAKLQEAHEPDEVENAVSGVIRRAVTALSKRSQIMNREAWLKEAKDAEKAGFPITSKCLISQTIGLGLDPVDHRRVLKSDAETAEVEGYYETARAILSELIAKYPARKGIWLRAARFEKKHGSRDKLDKLLLNAVKYCPQAEALWLMAARERWLAEDLEGARVILREAFDSNPNSEAIWLAAVKLEVETDELTRARLLLERARTQAPSGRVYMKSALLERRTGTAGAEKKLLEEGIEKFPEYRKLWLMLGQWHRKAKDMNSERSAYQRGLGVAGNEQDDVPLWVSLSAVETELGSINRARAVLERARQKVPKNEQLWLASVRLERKASQKNQVSDAAAGQLLAKALQDCPSSGMLWAEAVETEARPKQKIRSVDALKRCDKDARVMLAVARLLWRDRKFDKAQDWFQRAVALDPDLGDAWATMWAFEKAHGNKERVDAVEKKCGEMDPKHGELWIAVSKKEGNEGLKAVDILRAVGEKIGP
uniref:PRP1 splicing factor N-terminal domain-containing protein n=2 Tax=Rhodosorus marinus TaxID=101924 RepID=A0A7S3EEL7_9RHOD|mmetsp:Transcript_30358/g.116417  ORF Transcript_30358/g.116417 Transcript_30358/m.116417 type:complete len:929 (+) Transcript_30358:44-2830(+)